MTVVTDCIPCERRPEKYQELARQGIYAELDRVLLPWSWVASTCGKPQCLTVDHLTWTSPVHINYPPGVCIYCGLPAGTKDHLIPKVQSGESLRRYVAVVPACGECNSLIADQGGHAVSERREIAHRRIRKKYGALLSAPHRTEVEIHEFGPMLRKTIQANQIKREALYQRLAWPEDPEMDQRAFEQSGIEDPRALGVL